MSGDPAVAPQLGKFMGVRNGIDIDIWDPENDAFLPRTYGPDTVVEGKVTLRPVWHNTITRSSCVLPGLMPSWADGGLNALLMMLTAASRAIPDNRVLRAWPGGPYLSSVSD